MCFIKFDDDKEVEKIIKRLAAFAEDEDYKRLKGQYEVDPHHNWGDNLNVLIMSDRCPGRAKGLYEYLKQKTNLSSVKLCKTLNEAKKYILNVSIDILMFVGLQEDESNYEIKKILKEKNVNTYTVKYAFLDDTIKNYCIRYKIQHAFSSIKPAAEFIAYLKESYSTHNFLLSEKIDCETPIDERDSMEPKIHNTFLGTIKSRVKSIFSYG